MDVNGFCVDVFVCSFELVVDEVGCKYIKDVNGDWV